jgi:integrase
VSRVAAHGLYQKLYAEKGLHMARHIVATCRMAWSWAGRHGKVEANPWKDLGMETPDGRRRAASPAEIRHLVAVADGAGRPEIGDMIWLGLITAQRQADRLLMRSHQLAQGRFHVRQRKTGKTVTGPLGPVLAARLAAAQARRKNHRVAHPFAVIDERARAPFKADHYRHVFAAVVAKAALTMPGLAGFRDQDLRDTALTWARQGGASFEQRRGLSGHGPQAAQIEERHYLAGAGSPGDDAVAAILRVWQGEPGP